LKKLLSIFFVYIFTFSLHAQATQKGLVLKGGLWGLGGSFKSQYESISFTDDLLSGFGFGRLDLDWNEKKKYYILNPIGLDYYLGAGPGSLLFSFEARGLPLGENAFGFTPTYDYISIDTNPILGLHEAKVTYRNYDFTIGYQFAVSKFLITPKFLIRDFTNKYKDEAIFISRDFFGIGNKTYSSPGYASFIGGNFFFDINGTSGIFLDLIFTSPIQLPLPQIGALFNDQMEYKHLFLTNGAIGYTFQGKGTQVISGNRTLLGYQHKFGNLALQIGYHSETLNSRYEGHREIPIFIVRNNFVGIDVDEIIINRFVTYDQNNKTEIKSLYLALTYSL